MSGLDAILMSYTTHSKETSMNRNRSALVMAVGALLALPAQGRTQQPEMKEEQKAEMEA